MTLRIVLAACVVALLGCGGSASDASPTLAASPAAPAEPAPEVQAVLAKMKARYANAKTYRDEGTFKNVYASLDGIENHRRLGRFRTRWRPNQLLVVWDQEAGEFVTQQRIVVSSDARATTKALFLGKVEEHEDVGMALGAMQGVSNGVTGLVPSWLTAGCRLALKYELTGTTKCGDESCIVLEADRDQDNHVTIHLDATTYALRRYAWHGKLVAEPLSEERLAAIPEKLRERFRKPTDPFIVDREIVYTPTFDAKVDDSELAFDPLLD